MKLIVGLGNPGKEYENTRQNIGFMVIEKFLSKYNIHNDSEKYNGLYYETMYNDEKAILLKPLKYMNLSGEVVIQYVNFYKISKDDILIISDDLDMPSGKIKLKMKGSSGGHNGLKNIELHLGTNEYKRLKIGIANNKAMETKDYVLGKLYGEDKINIDESTTTAVSIIEDYLSLTFENLMN